MSLEVKMTHCLKPFTSTRDGGGIYVMNADGSEQTNISNNPASTVHLMGVQLQTLTHKILQQRGRKEVEPITT